MEYNFGRSLAQPGDEEGGGVRRSSEAALPFQERSAGAETGNEMQLRLAAFRAESKGSAPAESWLGGCGGGLSSACRTFRPLRCSRATW